MRFSNRVNKLELSRTAAVMQQSQALEAAGIDVADFGPGEPDFPTPETAGAAAVAAINDGFTRYTPVAGIKPLREAVAAHLNRKYGSRLDAANIIVTCGAKQAIYNLCQAVFQEGDEVLIPRPYWVTFPEAVTLSGAEPGFLDTDMDSGFRLNPEGLKSGINSRSRGLIVNYPNNPTGAVLEEDTIREIINLAGRNNLFLLSDETYDSFSYTGSPGRVHSFLSFFESGMQGAAVVGSFSKTYSMTGWRVGYAVGSPELINKMSALQSHQTGNPSSIAQKAALAVLDEPEDDLQERIQEYRRRRDLIADGLDSLPGIRCPRPEGAFYVFPDVRGLMESKGCRDSLELAEKLLTEQHVAVVPGSAFGCDGYLRFSYAASVETIEKGLARLGRFCRGI